MKATIFVVIVVLVFAFLSGVKIQFNPFKISFETLSFGIGWMLLVIAIGFIQYDSHERGYKKALKDVSELISEVEKKK